MSSAANVVFGKPCKSQLVSWVFNYGKRLVGYVPM